MFLNYLLAADTASTSGGGNKTQTIIMVVIIAVVLVLMIALTIIPQKKRQKQQQQMMDSLAVGTKLMTVGGLVGKITQVNSDNSTLIVNVGTENSPTLIVIDKKAVGYVLDKPVGVTAPAPAPAEEPALPLETAPLAEDTTEPVTSEEPFAEEVLPEETPDVVTEDTPVESEEAPLETEEGDKQ